MINLEKVKQKIKLVLNLKVTQMIVHALNIAIKSALMAAVLCSLIFLGAKAPELHGQWIRSKVGDKVYTIRNERGGGTGFAIRAPSGHTYIVTNDHVCSHASDKNENVSVINNDGESIQRRIIEHSAYSDLCLIEGVPGVDGLTMGPEPELGQIVASVGHPSLMPITLSKGEIIQKEDVGVVLGPISFKSGPDTPPNLVPEAQGGILEEKCHAHKNKIVEGQMTVIVFQLPALFCVAVTEKAFYTNMLIQPGSSGSPVVNFWGNVIGVVFASDRANWGILVNTNDLTQFLKNY
jgi:S1-C subfamily serine protease